MYTLQTKQKTTFDFLTKEAAELGLRNEADLKNSASLVSLILVNTSIKTFNFERNLD